MSTTPVALPAAADSKIVTYGAFTPDAVRQLMRLFAQLAPNAQLGLFYELAADNLVAAGNSQATALATTSQTTRLATVAAGTGILLPPSAPGLEVMVINHGANTLQVYGLGTDTIDDIATATGVGQMPNSLVIYTCTTAGKWYSEGLATGFATSGLQTLSNQDSLVAKVGGGQGGGPAINRMLNRIITVASAGDSITLPASAAGMEVTVTNAAAVNAMNVFPAVGDQINAAGVNAAVSVVVTHTVTFICYTAGQGHSLPVAL
jgi:hypothetical protein